MKISKGVKALLNKTLLKDTNLTLKKIMRFYGKFNFDQISIKTELQVILDK